MSHVHVDAQHTVWYGMVWYGIVVLYKDFNVAQVKKPQGPRENKLNTKKQY